MNQILVTEKVYITPELKRKKRIYKSSFIISILSIIVLVFIYGYSQYNLNKSESLAQDILASMEVEESEIDNTTIAADDEVWVVDLEATGNDDYETLTSVAYASETVEISLTGKYTASDGNVYDTVGTISIPSIDVNYPILSETTDALLKVSVCKFWGADPNEEGNLCIAGHNYRNSKFFGNVPDLETGDIIEVTDLTGTTVQYKVYNKYTVDPTDVSCTSQLTNGKKIVTLITCTDDGKQRVVVKAEEV